MRIKTYSELISIPDFKGRFEYLMTNSRIGEMTFNGQRLLNQRFYKSHEWLDVIRPKIIIRDSYNGYPCDLAHPDHPIRGRVIVHHLNPLSIEDLKTGSDFLLNPEFLVCISHETHNACHYGSTESLPKEYAPRKPNDTCPWRE